jgi:hypothetical protein
VSWARNATPRLRIIPADYSRWRRRMGTCPCYP